MKETKDRTIRTRTTGSEFEQIAANARNSNMTISEYLRSVALRQKVRPGLPETVRRSIVGFGRNLNQCAHHANECGVLHLEEVKNLRLEVQTLLALLSEKFKQ